MIEERLTLPDILPLLGGSRFHPLFTTQREENVRRVVKSPPHPFHHEMRKSHQQMSKEHQDRLRLILHKTTNAFRCTRENILRVMKGRTFRELKKEILVKDVNRLALRSDEHHSKAISIIIDGYYCIGRPQI